MTMNSLQLSAEIRANLAVAFPEGFPDTGAAELAWNAIAEAIVSHIQNNALIQVSSDVVVTSVSGVTTGTGISGGGTGSSTGTGTIT